MASIVKSIMASASETFAGIFGFLSPVMGPAAAGPAVAGEASVAAVAAAIPSFAVGTPWVQNDGLAMLHRGERVVTAADNAAGVGRGGDAHFHLGGLTINGSITPAELKSHIRTIAVGLKEHWQTNPTTRPAY
jgi:hypothetical protein